MTAVPTGLVNLRDLGAEGGPLPVAGVLLRSDAPLSGDQPPTLAAWPPHTVIDLRGRTERSEDHPLAPIANVISLPLLSGGPRRGPRRWPDRLADLYLGLLVQPQSELLIEALRLIAVSEPPVLVHCTAGKDRTGVTVAIALALAGIDRDDILADYVLTGEVMPQVLARMQATVRTATEGTSLATPPPHIAQAPPEAVEGLLQALDAHEDGARGWFLACGGDQETLTRLRRRLMGA